MYKAEYFKKNKRKAIESNHRYRKSIIDLVASLKNQPCTDCNSTYHHAVMEFDHVRAEKCFDVSFGVRNRSLDAIKTEIEKCDLVCANCHRERTFQRNNLGLAKNANDTKLWLRALKEATPCMDCGRNFRWYQCEFDHRPGTQKHCNVARMTSRTFSVEAIKREIEKCDLVCSNCHRIRTIDRLQK